MTSLTKVEAVENALRNASEWTNFVDLAEKVRIRPRSVGAIARRFPDLFERKQRKLPSNETITFYRRKW